MFLCWVLFQGPGNFLLWWELKWAGRVGRGVWNVYKGVGLYGNWGSWRIWWLEWKLVGHFRVLHAYAYVMSQCITDNLAGMLRSGHLFPVTSCQSGMSRPVSSSGEFQ